MKLSIIWLFDENADNDKTFSSLDNEFAAAGEAELLFYATEQAEKAYQDQLGKG